ncbi:MAG: hypothetical protein PHS37_09615 [Candidatus Omnitrophica bacterium]|nr:hypothetical protein [Candidatus Omnitrophota bacterium]
MRSYIPALAGVVSAAVICFADSPDVYPVHSNIPVTVFHPAEKGNVKSAWDEQWGEHIKDENPFYAALPYNDFGKNGRRKKNAHNVIYWARLKMWGSRESMCKNRWIKIIKDGNIVYAQWEDVGPYRSDDARYVFGTRRPAAKKAGIDVSVAVQDHLNLRDRDTVDWQFVDDSAVPLGPWRKI